MLRRLALLWLLVACVPASRPSEVVTGTASNAPDLAPILEPFRANDGLPSLAAVAVRDGRVISSAAIGERALGSGVAVTLSDKYWLGDLNKSFTATALARLVERGSLRWDTTLGSVFPEIQMLEVYRSVTLEQLLMHSAGLSANLETSAFDPKLEAAQARQELLRMALTTAPQYPPGQVVAYSNTGYLIASLMAERASGQSWRELITRGVLEPLNMTDCAFGASFPSLSDPHPHRWNGRLAVALEPGSQDSRPPVFSGVEDLRCSLPDLGRYLAAHLSGERGQDGILKASTFQYLHRARASGGQGIYAALGWFVLPSGGIWHNGSDGFSYAEMVFYPRQNFAVAVASNAPVELAKGVQAALEAVTNAMKLGP